MRSAAELDLDWPGMLRAAVTGHGLRAVYQPIVDLSRGTVVGYEALIRFTGYPQHNPDPWFAAAHRHGLSAELQAAALRVALEQRGGLPRNCFLTVNVGPEVLHHPDVRRVFADTGNLNGLVVELTEHFAVDDYRALEPDLDRLRNAGALIAIDDAGSGYAGLTQLLTLRPSMIKLDRALIQDVDRDEAKRALVEMVGTFAGRIDAWLLAEGIERRGELETLAALHVPLAQGFHLGRPAAPWASLADDAGVLLAGRPPRHGQATLRRLLEHPPVVSDPGLAYAAFADPAVSVVVVCDADDRPVAVIDDSTAPIPMITPGMRINLDTTLADAAQRAITRPDWSQPLLCTDNAGRYVGVVAIPRLLDALAAQSAR